MPCHPDRVRRNYDEPTLQRAFDIVNGNWDAWKKEVDFEASRYIYYSDIAELLARIVTDLQTHGHR